MARVYEVMFIVRPDVVEEEIDKLIAGFSTTVTNGNGVVKSVEKMGRRKLAYIVRKSTDGFYVLMTIEADGATELELKRRLRVSEPIIKFIVVRTDEEEKRLAKVKALFSMRLLPLLLRLLLRLLWLRQLLRRLLWLPPWQRLPPRPLLWQRPKWLPQ